ncbi:acylphosphatase [bacterium]|nr:acylphosphatase [bacterium]
MKAFHATIEGEVQGVGFRYSAMREANERGIVGWVRNTADDAVEVWAEGGEAELAAFRTWLETGPLYARVDRVALSREQPTGKFSSFSIAF